MKIHSQIGLDEEFVMTCQFIWLSLAESSKLLKSDQNCILCHPHTPNKHEIWKLMAQWSDRLEIPFLYLIGTIPAELSKLPESLMICLSVILEYLKEFGLENVLRITRLVNSKLSNISLDIRIRLQVARFVFRFSDK